MDAAHIARGGLTGTKGKVAQATSSWLARHTPLRREWLLAAFGAVFIAAAIRTLVSVGRTATGRD